MRSNAAIHREPPTDCFVVATESQNSLLEAKFYISEVKEKQHFAVEEVSARNKHGASQQPQLNTTAEATRNLLRTAASSFQSLNLMGL